MARPRQRRCHDASTGEGIWEAGIGGPRLAWVHYEGGNYQQASLATALSRKPRSVRFPTGLLYRTTGNTVGQLLSSSGSAAVNCIAALKLARE
jgi:hypothetical protein